MKTRLLIAGLVVAAGVQACARTTTEIVQDGHQTERLSKKPVLEAARCVSANAETAVAPMTAVPIQRPLNDKGAVELTIRGGSGGAVSVAHIEPATTGSRIIIWMSPSMAFGEATMAERFLEGC